MLRWRTGAFGCLVPLLVLTTILFALAAVRPTLAAELAGQRGGALIGYTSAMTLGGVNVLLALFALYLAWEAFRFGWRWADEVAVTCHGRCSGGAPFAAG